MRTNGLPPELFANVRTSVAFVACTRAENQVRFRTIRRAPQGRDEPVRGSYRVASDLRGSPTRPRTAEIADTGCHVRERARSSPRNSSPSSRRDQRGCLVSQSLEGHIHNCTLPRQKPAPRVSSRENQRSRAQDLLVFPLMEPVHEGDSRREVHTGKKGQICLFHRSAEAVR